MVAVCPCSSSDVTGRFPARVGMDRRHALWPEARDRCHTPRTSHRRDAAVPLVPDPVVQTAAPASVGDAEGGDVLADALEGRDEGCAV